MSKLNIASQFFKYLKRIISASRLNRIQYLKAQLVALLIPMSIGSVCIYCAKKFGMNFDTNAADKLILALFYCLLGGFYIVISLCAGMARLRDCNHSGWWILPINITTKYLVFPWFLLFFWPGSKGDNSYGQTSYRNISNENLVWSDNPGCFEYHLKRKFNNPIYSLDERTISQNQISKARKKDTKEMGKFIKLCAEFEYFQFDDLYGLQKETQKLIEEAYKTGGTALNLIPGFMKSHDEIMKEWKDSVLDHPDRLEVYSAFEAVTKTIFDTFLNLFIIQTIRSDSPIKKDLAEAVLSEDMETIKKFTMWSIRNNREESFKTDLTHKVNAMISRGENIPMLDDKLKLLGIELKTRVFKEEEFIEKIHNSAKYLPDTTHTSELIKCIISGDMAKVFKLHEDLMDAVIRFRKSSAASDLVAAIEANELREKIMEDVQIFYEKKGEKDIVELIEQGRTRVSRYMKIQPVRDKIIKWGGLALFASGLIYMWK